MRTVFVLVDFWTPMMIDQRRVVQQACLLRALTIPVSIGGKGMPA